LFKGAQKSVERRRIMLKRISIILLSTLMVATFMLCAATQVIAEGNGNGLEIQTECNGVGPFDYTIYADENSPYVLEGSGPHRLPPGYTGEEFRVDVADGVKSYLWVYTANCGRISLKKLNLLAFNLPVLKPEIEVVGPFVMDEGPIPQFDFREECIGKLGFGKGICTGRTLTVPARWEGSSMKIGYFVTNYQTDGPLDPAAVYNKFLVATCDKAIRGPGESLSTAAAVPFFSRLTVEQGVVEEDNGNGNGQTELVEYCIEIDGRTGCPDPVEPKIYPCACVDENNGDPTGCPTLLKDTSFEIKSDAETASLLICQAPGVDPRCPICKIGANPCTWITLAGVPFGPICW